MTISHAEFNDALDNLSSSPGAVPYDAQDGGTLAPSGSLPPERVPGSRRSARSLPRTPSPIGLLGAARDAICLPYSLAPATVCRSFDQGSEFSAAYEGRCHGFAQRLCGGGDPPFPPPVPDAPPIAGGQCEGIAYQVSIETTRFGSGCNPASNGTGSVNVWGPVLDVRLVPVPGDEARGRSQLEVLCRGSTNDPVGELQYLSAGFRQNLSAQSCPYGVIDFISVTRLDGQPDDCGDAPPRYRDDPNYVPDIDITIDIGGNSPVAISPSVNIDAGGINFDLPSIGDVSIDLGGINFRPPGSSPGDGDPGDPGDEPPAFRPPPDSVAPDPSDPPVPTPPPDDPAVEEPTEKDSRVIRAVLVTVSNITPSQGLIFQENNPDVIIPDAGIVNFRVQVGDGASGWTPDQLVKNSRCLIPCPYDGGAFDVKGTPRPGVTWSLTPLYDKSSIPAT